MAETLPPEASSVGPQTGPAQGTSPSPVVIRDPLLMNEETKEYEVVGHLTGMKDGTLPGVSSQAEALRSITSQVPDAIREIRNQLVGNPPEGPRGPEPTASPEAELNPEGKDPDTIVDILLRISNMDAETRENHREQFQRAVDILIAYTNDDKLLELDWEISNQLIKLEKFDKEMVAQVEQVKPEQGEKFQELLDQLDTAELFLDNFTATLASDAYKDLYSDEEWKEFQTKKQKYETDKANLRPQIIAMTNPDFLQGRDAQKQAIKDKKIELEQKRAEAREEEIRKRSTESDSDEAILERKLLIGEHPGAVPVEATFEKQNTLYKQQKTAEAERGLSRYFHEARNLGLFHDLEKRLEQKYMQWVNSMSQHQEVSQMEMMEGLPGRIVSKSYPEVETEIIAYFRSLLDTKEPGYVEDPVLWSKFERRGVSSQARPAFLGIRVEFIERAQAQILDSLENLDRRRENLSPFPLPQRVSGEWNVHIMERRIREEARKQVLEREAEPLYRRESYYKVTLMGKNRPEVELGADQAAEDIMKSINDFDIQAIEIRTQALVEAIQNRRKLIQTTEGEGKGISESAAQAIVDSIKDRITNKVNFHILQWAGQNLQMGFFAGYLGKQVQSRGVEKLKEFPAMSDGLVGMAAHLLLNAKFRLYHRPQGWKGQMKDEDTTHKFLRGNIQGKIAALLMEYELKGGDARERLTKVHSWEDFMKQFQRKGLIPVGNKDFTYEQYIQQHEQSQLLAVPDLNNPGQLKPYKILPLEEYKKIEQYLTLSRRSSYRDDYYEYIFDQINKKAANVTAEDLDDLREAREARASEYIRYENARERVDSAVAIANQVLDIYGESAEMGDPSIVMRNGDFISLREVTLVCKLAVLDVDQLLTTDGRRLRLNNLNETTALIRERSKVWIKRAARAGYDRTKADNKFTINLPGGQQLTVNLAKGFEETGFTQAQWQVFKDAWVKLNENGYKTRFSVIKRDERGNPVKEENGKIVKEEKTFAEIIKMQYLRPLKNNYLADYKSSMSQINSKKVRERVAKGSLPIIRNILVRLGFKDRKTIDGTTQYEIDQYTQLIEDSRSFDAGVESLIYYTVTHPDIERTADGNYPPFNPDAVDYGFQGMNWGVKRLRHLRAFWLTNLNRTVPRGVDLMDMIPTLDRLAGEMDFDDILDLALNVNTAKNGMESVDNPALIQYANRVKTMVYLRGKGEGSVAESERGLDKDWGSFEKWLMDANAFWKVIEGFGIKKDAVRKKLETLVDEKTDADTIGADEAEAYVDAIQAALGRFQPLLTGNEKLLAEDRQALSSGAGYEDNEKKMFRFSEWLRSAKKGSGREEGGLIVQEEIADIIRLMMAPGTFTPGRKYRRDEKGKQIEGNRGVILSESPSIWEEAMRKLTPSHNPRLSRVLSLAFELN